MDNKKLLSIAESNEAPFYLYDLSVINDKVALIKETFPEFQLLYSIKANPHSSIVEHLIKIGVGIDAASANEVRLAISKGCTREKAFYSSPGKTVKDLTSTTDKCQIIADSINEMILLNSLASKLCQPLHIGVRLNIDNKRILESHHEVMSGRSSKFGISLDDFRSIDSSAFPSLIIDGLHVYFGSQLLDPELITNNFSIIADTALKIKKYYDIKYVNFGGGFGVPYEKGELDINLKHLGLLLHSDFAFNKLLLTSTALNLELGRFLVAECGLFITRVLDVKKSYGKKYVIIDGGMNTFYRPIMTGDFHEIIQFCTKGEMEVVTLVGKLCTPIDKYYDNILLFPVSVGDFIAFKNAGAYGYSMSLLEFISYNKPKEIVI
jgi:diaminopimelate decarboxylase